MPSTEESRALGFSSVMEQAAKKRRVSGDDAHAVTDKNLHRHNPAAFREKEIEDLVTQDSDITSDIMHVHPAEDDLVNYYEETHKTAMAYLS